MKSYAAQRWIGTGSQIAGATLMATKLAIPPVAYLIMLVGSCLWFFVAIRRADRPLAVLNAGFTGINVVGLIAWSFAR